MMQTSNDLSDDELMEAENATLRQQSFQAGRHEQTGGGSNSNRGRFHVHTDERELAPNQNGNVPD